MEHFRLQINIASPIVLEEAVVETQKQYAGVIVTQSLDGSIITT
jgi:hypothetical protein